jgi:hypothetical protein
MSDADENKENYGDIDSAIHAIAPKLSQEEGQVDVSSSPAFQCLDDVSTYLSMFLPFVYDLVHLLYPIVCTM